MLKKIKKICLTVFLVLFVLTGDVCARIIDSFENTIIPDELLKRYVEIRHTITSDRNEMKARWGEGGELQRLSSDAVFSGFQENAKILMEKALRENEIRTVKVISVLPYHVPDWYLINFNIIKQAPNMEKKIEAYVATVQVGRYNKIKKLKSSTDFQILKYGYETKEIFEHREKAKQK